MRSALRFIPCREVSYDAWVEVGMALHRGEAYGCVEDGLGLWRAWPATDPDRYKAGECEAKWRGFDADGGLTLGSLILLTKQHGWKGCRFCGDGSGRKWRRERFLDDRGWEMDGQGCGIATGPRGFNREI